MIRPNLYDYLKILAIITMIIDHVWLLFFPELDILRIIGRTSFPLFLFLVWYNHSYWWKSSLWIYWTILQMLMWIWSYYWLVDMWYANILLAIWCTIVIMYITQKHHSLVAEIILYLVSAWLARYTYPYMDYGTLSIVFALLGYWTRKYGNTRLISMMITVSVWYHLFFMHSIANFGDQSILLAFIWVLLFLVMYMMSKRNYALQASNQQFNQLITTISSYALEIYLIQIVILGGIYLII